MKKLLYIFLILVVPKLVFAAEAAYMRAYLPSGISASNTYAEAGYLDCEYHASVRGNTIDATGVQDSTNAIQECVDDAIQYNLVALLKTAGGTYLVSDQIYIEQPKTNLQISACQDQNYYDNSFHQGKDPALVGPSSGTRPKIKLANSSSGFGSAGSPKAIIFMKNVVNGDGCGFNIEFSNIDIENGTGNPGAIGVQHSGAQGSTAYNSKVDFSNGGYACFRLKNSTNTYFNLEAIGGQYGVYFDSSTVGFLTAFKATNQTAAAIYLTAGQFIITGFEISTTSAAYGVQIASGAIATYTSLYDGSISISTGTNAAILNNNLSSVYLRDVYVNNTGGIIKNSGTTVSSSGYGSWDKVNEHLYVNTDEPTINSIQWKNYKFLNGSKNKTTYSNISNDVTAPTTADIRLLHTPPALPFFTDSGVCDVIQDYGATGDGSADDTAEFQAAAAACDKIFIPRGDYIVKGQVTLADPDAIVFGIGGEKSAVYSCNADSSSCWEPGSYSWTFVTQDSASAETFFANFSVEVPNQYDASRAGAVSWKAGESSNSYNLIFRPQLGGADENSYARKIFQVSSNGGGRHWNHMYHFGTATSNGTNNVNARSFYATGTTQALTLYSPNPEHAQYGSTAAEIEFNNVTDARVLGIKTEAWADPIRFTDSDNVMLLGLSIHTGSNPWAGFYDCSNFVAVSVPRTNSYFNPAQYNIVRYVSSVAQEVFYQNEGGYFEYGAFDDSPFNATGGGGTPTETIINCSAPSGTLPLGTTTDDIECTTDVDATLKFDTSNVAYASMGTTFSSTGNLTHSHTLTGLTNGSSYTYYVRAADSTSSTVVSFSVEDTPPSGTNLLNSNTYIAGSDTNTYDSCYQLENLWDDDTSSGVCGATIGGSGITSAAPQFDLGQLHDITLANVFGDADGSWVCNTWKFEHKQESGDSWTEAWGSASCNSNDWDVHDSLSITARYLRLTFSATTNLQVREAVVNGTVNTGSGGGGGGGPVISGGGVVIHAPKGAGMISN
jgi:hypothetical protein